MHYKVLVQEVQPLQDLNHYGFDVLIMEEDGRIPDEFPEVSLHEFHDHVDSFARVKHVVKIDDVRVA